MQGRSDKVTGAALTTGLEISFPPLRDFWLWFYTIGNTYELAKTMRHSLRSNNGLHDGVIHNGTSRPHDTFGKDAETNRDASLSGSDTASEISAQAGVKRIEAVSKAWTKTSLIIAYVTYVQLFKYRGYSRLTPHDRLLLIANVTSLEIQVTSLMSPFAVSAFQTHSLLSTIYVVQGVVSG
jgi:SP family sugar:H+ symporter-like MFS transporter